MLTLMPMDGQCMEGSKQNQIPNALALVLQTSVYASSQTEVRIVSCEQHSAPRYYRELLVASSLHKITEDSTIDCCLKERSIN